jgi:two-component system, OmpR family, response regulator
MRILVVEDDTGIGELVVDELTREGYAVDWAQDGDEALSLTESFPYDLLVLDLMLPGKDGFTVAQTLRLHKQRVPILMLTARDGIDDRVKGLELGADDYLVKPFHLKELRARVRALLRRSQGEASNLVEVGRLNLDLEKKQVWWQKLELAGGFYSREALLEHVWPGEASIDPRTVDTYILYLRRKLATDAIETVRNLGYTFRG